VSENPPDEPSRDDLQGLPTVSLLARARAGDVHARNLLLQRHRPALVRWVHGRLPLRTRDDQDTEDIVQRSLIRALEPMERFEPRHEGAFLAYLCKVAQNLMLDDHRKVQRRPERVELEEHHADAGPTPLDLVVDGDELEHYEEALLRLPEDFRVAIRLRLELDYSYAEMAKAMERPTENAARLLLQRAVKRLVREMNARRRRPGPRS
jgi:RNA polymerase sigma-70 factor (ECF subfamily)